MSTVKPTLSTDEAALRKAKRLKREHQRTGSELLSRHIAELGRLYNDMPKDSGPITKQLLGIARLPRGKSADQVREEAMFKKYGIKK